MVRKIEVAPEKLAEAKRLYEQALAPVNDIAAMLGMSRSPFYHLVKEQGWRRRRASASEFEFARALTDTGLAAIASPCGEITASDDPVTQQQRAALAQRIQTVVERQMDAIERVLNAVAPADQGDAERSARTLASVSRALREAAALNRSDEAPPPDETDADPVPRDMDAFREELARRIHALIDARAGREGARGGGIRGEDGGGRG